MIGRGEAASIAWNASVLASMEAFELNDLDEIVNNAWLAKTMLPLRPEALYSPSELLFITFDISLVTQHPTIQLRVVVRRSPAIVLEIRIPLETDFLCMCLLQRIDHLYRCAYWNNTVQVTMKYPFASLAFSKTRNVRNLPVGHVLYMPSSQMIATTTDRTQRSKPPRRMQRQVPRTIPTHAKPRNMNPVHIDAIPLHDLIQQCRQHSNVPSIPVIHIQARRNSNEILSHELTRLAWDGLHGTIALARLLAFP